MVYLHGPWRDTGGNAEDRPTWQRAAKDLHPQADAPVVEPGLRVYADVAGHHGDGQLVENGDLLFTVSFKYLGTHRGKGRSFRARLSRDRRVSNPLGGDAT